MFPFHNRPSSQTTFSTPNYTKVRTLLISNHFHFVTNVVRFWAPLNTVWWLSSCGDWTSTIIFATCIGSGSVFCWCMDYFPFGSLLEKWKTALVHLPPLDHIFFVFNVGALRPLGLQQRQLQGLHLQYQQVCTTFTTQIEEDDVRRKFSEFGTIKSLILKKKDNNVTYSFIEYDKPEFAKQAITEYSPFPHLPGDVSLNIPLLQPGWTKKCSLIAFSK